MQCSAPASSPLLKTYYKRAPDESGSSFVIYTSDALLFLWALLPWLPFWLQGPFPAFPPFRGLLYLSTVAASLQTSSEPLRRSHGQPGWRRCFAGSWRIHVQSASGFAVLSTNNGEVSAICGPLSRSGISRDSGRSLHADLERTRPEPLTWGLAVSLGDREDPFEFTRVGPRDAAVEHTGSIWPCTSELTGNAASTPS